MGGMNIIGVLKGGLAAALIMNVSQYALWVIGVNTATSVAALVLKTTALGVATVWLYAAIRPRFGPGPKTAIWRRITRHRGRRRRLDRRRNDHRLIGRRLSLPRVVII
jgi:hypothetical protein